MIDSDFMIQYTNALYSTPVEFAPRYDEFRDMFSKGQLLSKQWLIENFPYKAGMSVCIAGAWFGTLGAMLLKKYNDIKITFLDIDPRCERFLKNIFWNDPRVKLVTCDMLEYHYEEDLIINTSCEHIDNLWEWLNIPTLGTKVILQSNNYNRIPEHINCVFSVDDFKIKAGLDNETYSGELDAGIFTRYMLIGTT